MARTTEVAVRNIIDTALTSDQVKQFIDDAALFVTEEIATAGAGLSDARLEMIERYLACALVRIRDLGVTTFTFGRQAVLESYQTDPQVSEYLKRAASLDPTGKIQRQFMPEAGATRIPFLARVGRGFAADIPVE